MAGTRATGQGQRGIRQPWPWFALALALTGFGFWPSFLSNLGNAPIHLLVHGLSATLWMALPVLQALLILRRHRGLHRQIGYASLLLAGIVIFSGLRVVQTMVIGDDGADLPTLYKFVLLDLTGIALFAAFVGLAILAARRRDIGLHLRLMACSTIIPLEAANERTAMILFPDLVPSFGVALYFSLVSVEIVCAGLIAAEWRSGRVRWPFPLLLGYYLVMHALVTPIAMSPQFRALADAYARLGG
ncbi:hypothetical protein [Sandarakinorhabdus rubra]|uniref:hypothetical protein n=1 Tax=Sandarakinorhabdus rubra TaxID=2672568 RepID=UPI0013DBFFDB|nr:hypothetical protein [Sandarakinorhabdus rubra]